jgi:hypothetical protein
MERPGGRDRLAALASSSAVIVTDRSVQDIARQGLLDDRADVPSFCVRGGSRRGIRTAD